MKKSKILIPALGILVLSTAASITGTVAWFSVNNSVTVNGMQVTTKVSSNLLIAETNAEDQFGSALTQGRVGTLEPASSNNGVNYFYTTDANADGSKHAPLTGTNSIAFSSYDESTGTALANAGAGKEKYDAGFNTAYLGDVTVTTSNVVYGYMDYSFYLKATNASEDKTAEIRMTKCNLLYNNAALAGDSAAGLAWRVAVFSVDTEKETAVDNDVSTTNNKSILALSGAQYFESGKAAASATTRDSVSNFGTAVKVKTGLAAGGTIYEKVTVRLWLEGEDKSCNNDTYAKLTNSWKLDLAFSIAETGSTETAVTAIGSAL